MENISGIHPVEYRVLIKPDTLEEKSEGGIYIPDNAMERMQHAQDIGTLVEASDQAFSDWKGRKPKPGDKVIFNKYAGSEIRMKNKGDYRLCNDKDILAVMEE